MSKLKWDLVGDRLYETGIDQCVLFPASTTGYAAGVAWNGIVSVAEKPSGAESNPQYADNIKYLNLISAEEFGATIEAFTYPPEFEVCDGTAEIAKGVYVRQQVRRPFGLCYRTRIGNDVDGPDHGFKLHFVYGAMATPSEKNYSTINDNPEAITFSWEISTTPVDVPNHRPTASLVIDSTVVDNTKLASLMDIVYGKDGTTEGDTGTDPRLPLPAEIYSIFQEAAG